PRSTRASAPTWKKRREGKIGSPTHVSSPCERAISRLDIDSSETWNSRKPSWRQASSDIRTAVGARVIPCGWTRPLRVGLQSRVIADSLSAVRGGLFGRPVGKGVADRRGVDRDVVDDGRGGVLDDGRGGDPAERLARTALRARRRRQPGDAPARPAVVLAR